MKRTFLIAAALGLVSTSPAWAQAAQLTKAPSWSVFALPKQIAEKAKPAPADRRVQTPEARQEEVSRADTHRQSGSRAMDNYGRESSVLKRDKK